MAFFVIIIYLYFVVHINFHYYVLLCMFGCWCILNPSYDYYIAYYKDNDDVDAMAHCAAHCSETN